MQQRLKRASRAARAEVVSAELFQQFLVAMDEALAAFYFGLRREAFPAFADDLESSRYICS
jgi:hypothetical protein